MTEWEQHLQITALLKWTGSYKWHVIPLWGWGLQLWEFGLGVEREYPHIGHRAVGILFASTLSYLYEMGFTAVK